jgi:hypothetical protein
MRRIRTFAVLALLPIMAFSCITVRHLSVVVPQSSGTTIEVLSDEYQKVIQLVEDWAQRRGTRPSECEGRREGPGCKAFSLDPNTKVSVLFLPAERRTEVEIFAYGGSSPAIEQAEKELRELLKSQFNATQVKEGAFW